MRKSNFGFSLIELLVVISIVAVLIAMLLPTLSESREVARRVVCASNMTQWYRVHVGYSNDNKGVFPGRKMWDLALDSFQPQLLNHSSGTGDLSIFKLPAYGWIRQIRRCPSRTFGRTGEFPATFDSYNGPGYYSYWMRTDYYSFWGRATHPSVPATSFGWQYATTRVNQNYGPVPNNRVTRRTDTPLMMDSTNTADNPQSYKTYGGADGSWGSNHALRGGVPNPNRIADGTNLMRYEGSVRWFSSTGPNVNYLSDYYNRSPIPVSALPLP
jgi:prepilin-type N-terminal cleavage/methylation domain-containing protein